MTKAVNLIDDNDSMGHYFARSFLLFTYSNEKSLDMIRYVLVIICAFQFSFWWFAEELLM